MVAMDDEHESTLTYDIVMMVLYTVVVGVNVYLIVDSLTDGALSTSVGVRLAHGRQKVSQWREKQRAYRQSIGRVMWQATNIVEGEDEQ